MDFNRFVDNIPTFGAQYRANQRMYDYRGPMRGVGLPTPTTRDLGTLSRTMRGIRGLSPNLKTGASYGAAGALGLGAIGSIRSAGRKWRDGNYLGAGLSLGVAGGLGYGAFTAARHRGEMLRLLEKGAVAGITVARHLF